ncbi:MAG: M1 family metallopeptidase [Anaerolineales bacterium]
MNVARLAILLLFAFFLLAACAERPPAPPTPLPSIPTQFPPPIPAQPLTPSPTSLPPSPSRTRYALYVTMDVQRKQAKVHEQIEYLNTSGNELTEIVMAVVPNLWPQGFQLESLRVQGREAAKIALEGQRLSLSFPEALAPEETLRLEMDYRLFLPFAEQKDPNLERPRIYGYTARQINLTNWYPFVVPYREGEGWILHDPWFYGEHLVYEAADYDVYLKLENAAEDWVISASAPPNQAGEWMHYSLSQGRVFVFSLSQGAQVAQEEQQGILLQSVFFPPYQAGGQAVLQAMRQALLAFTERFGPYPHTSLTAVMGDFNDGMEYSAFFFLPRDFYNIYDGTPKNYLTFIAAHETAHQWWFERVANDQAQEPWLDEALCTYSELLFYESFDPSLIPWWWSYRVDFYQPEGFVNIPIYEGQGFRPYTNAVYLRGAHFIHDLRQRIGEEAFFAFLKDYQEQMNGKIATSEDFFRILKQHAQAELGEVLGKYLRGRDEGR